MMKRFFPRFWLGRRHDWVTWAAVLAIMGIGLALRLYRLDQQSLWMDEFMAFRHLKAPDLSTHLRLLELIVPEVAATPIYYALQYWLAHWITASPDMLRLLPILFGVAGIPLLYLLGARMFGRGVGRVAALCLALSPQHIWHAQELRAYEIITPFAITALYALVRSMEENKRRWWAVNLATNMWIVWAHMFAVFLLPVEGLFLLVSPRGGFRKTCIWTVVHVAFLIPWVYCIQTMPYVHFFHSAGVSAGEIYKTTITNDIVSTHTDLLPGWKTNPLEQIPPERLRLLAARPRMDWLLYGFLTACFVALLVRIAYLLLKNIRLRKTGREIREQTSPYFFLLALIVLPVAALATIENGMHRIAMNPMYCMYNQIGLYLAVGLAMASLRYWMPKLAFVAVLLVLYGYQLAIFLPDVTRLNWRAGAQYIESNLVPGDAVVNLVHYWPEGELAYYLQETKMHPKTVLTFQAACDDAARYIAAAAPGERRRVWLAFESYMVMVACPKSDPLEALRTGLKARNLRCNDLSFPGHYNLVVFCIEADDKKPVCALDEPITPLEPIPDDGLFRHTPLDPGVVLHDLGIKWSNEAQHQEMMSAVRETIEFWPIPTFCFSSMFFYIAPCLDFIGRNHIELSEALAWYAIRENPDFGLAYFALGSALAASKDRHGASEAFQAAFARHKGLEQILGPFVASLCEKPDPGQTRRDIERLQEIGFAFADSLYAVCDRAFGPDPAYKI